MLCRDIVDVLERQSPAEYAMSWDNVGLLVGRHDQEVNKILIAVDATCEVCDKAINEGYDMIITHHPMIFGKLSRVNDDSVVGRKILGLAEASICCYAMHTNFDTKGGMAKEAARMLGMKNREVLEESRDGEGIGQTGILDRGMSVYDLAQKVKDVFGLEQVMLFGDKDRVVEKIAVSPGSGKSVIECAAGKGVQCLITGDIGHHEGIDAIEMGLTVIDASHYGIEKIFMNYIKNYLEDFCPDTVLDVFDTGIPFEVV